ncbi:MAG: hypothetical protein KAG37_10180 [Flavobacteriales bacterium]|nr:hypothetical protein [Flavobacteriales bacterium]
MNTINDLTREEFTQLLDGYFAPPIKRTMMTELEVKSLAEKLNKRINVPLIRETREEKILIKIVIKIDVFLYDNLPNEFYDLIRSLDEGIDDDEATRLTNTLTRLANAKINIPYIPELAEGIAIKFIIRAVIGAARKGFQI